MDMQKSLNAPSQVATANGSPGTATAALANPSQSSPSPGVNLRWYIDGFSASIDGTVTTKYTVTVQDGSTVLHTFYFPVAATTTPGPSTVSVVLTHPWRCSVGNAAQIIASAGAGANITVTIWGHKDD